MGIGASIFHRNNSYISVGLVHANCGTAEIACTISYNIMTSQFCNVPPPQQNILYKNPNLCYTTWLLSPSKSSVWCNVSCVL